VGRIARDDAGLFLSGVVIDVIDRHTRDVPAHAQHPVPTTGGDTILRIPPNGCDDRQLIIDTCRNVAAAYVETQHLPDAQRREAIAKRLSSLNTADTNEVNPDRGKIFEFKTLA
jgi:hypothetical protein